ncbi:MAG: hypothetical protein JWM73_1627 [Solirubrobacterales bacterium]|nr:hypothetical protein [Solirubrobacterales bacterium]
MIAAQAPDPPVAIPKSCHFTALKSARPQTTDPTSFEDDPAVVLAPGRYVAIEGVKVVMRRGKKVLATQTLDRLSTSGGVVRLLPPTGQAALAIGQGNVTIRVTGTRAAACPKRVVDYRGTWSFSAPTLPVRAAPATTFVEDARLSGLRLYLRSVGQRVVRGVRATLLKDNGKAIATAKTPAALEDGTILDVAVPDSLAAGRYRLRFSGRPEGSSSTQTWTTDLVLGSRGGPGSPPVDQAAGLSEQHVTVDWSHNRAGGRDTAGFVAPGIGYGEIVCGFQQQHVRFYPNDVGREQSMMLWTYKDWQENSEKSIRESVHTQFTGPSFQEGLNKFSPPEKHMTGEYEGIITDRGVLDAPFAGALAPPTYIKVDWTWDFSDRADSSCHVDATLVTENGDPTTERPLARSVQVVWRGDPNAAGHDTSVADVPGVGTVSLTCQALPGGTRTLRIDPAELGGSVTVREGGEDKLTNYSAGPLVVQLPNNGQVTIGLYGGASLMVSSRWKVNDPKPGENWCRVAAQAVVR